MVPCRKGMQKDESARSGQVRGWKRMALVARLTDVVGSTAVGGVELALEGVRPRELHVSHGRRSGGERGESESGRSDHCGWGWVCVCVFFLLKVGVLRARL